MRWIKCNDHFHVNLDIVQMVIINEGISVDDQFKAKTVFKVLGFLADGSPINEPLFISEDPTKCEEWIISKIVRI